MAIGDELEFRMVREHSQQWDVSYNGTYLGMVTEGWEWKSQQKYTLWLLADGIYREFTRKHDVVDRLVRHVICEGLAPTKCERPGCKRWAKYLHPGFWCGKHWRQWWDYGVKGKNPKRWMTHRVDGSERIPK